MRSGDVRSVHIATAPNETVAMMWRDLLRDEGIIAAIHSGGAGYAFGHNLLNEQYILVREDQAERAKQIIDEFESDEGLILWDDFDDVSWPPALPSEPPRPRAGLPESPPSGRRSSHPASCAPDWA